MSLRKHLQKAHFNYWCLSKDSSLSFEFPVSFSLSQYEDHGGLEKVRKHRFPVDFTGTAESLLVTSTKTKRKM